MRLSEIQHQDRALAILRRALRSGRTHHAYLFDGPDGVGKELTARALAARLLCLADRLAPDADACGSCASCHLVASDNHPDLHVIHRGLHKLHSNPTIRASKGLFLVVDVIRQFLIEPAGLKPTHGPLRVFLIREAERMNEEAQNALLKTLEEPPGAACLILVTSAASRLLPTIRSRCQHVPFSLLPPAFVADQLRGRFDVPVADARALAGLAQGQLGVALLWHRLGLLKLLEPVGAALDELPATGPEPFGKALVELASDLAARLPQSGEEEADEDEDDATPARAGSTRIGTAALRAALKLVLVLIAGVYRDALVVQAGAAKLTHLAGADRRTAALAQRHATDALDGALRAVTEAERMLDRNVAAQLVCERLAVALLGETAPA